VCLEEGVYNRLISYFYMGEKNVQHLTEKNCIVKNVMNSVANMDSRECSSTGVRRISRRGANIHKPGV